MSQTKATRNSSQRNARATGTADLQVGQQLKQLREERGLTQGELGAAVGVTFQQIQKYERGTNRISASRLFEFATVLNVAISTFFAGLKTGNDDTQARTEMGALMTFAESREGINLLTAFAAIKSAPARRHLLQLVKTLARRGMLTLMAASMALPEAYYGV